jgi:hypothetical protein
MADDVGLAEALKGNVVIHGKVDALRIGLCIFRQQTQ